jgi:formate hydrogenlyase subunit 6/NADH:ubiquinone oxidoreductase subunit I
MRRYSMGFDLRQKGHPTVDRSTCTGCGQCVKICPDGVLVLEGGKPKAGGGWFTGCIACGHCIAVCPTGSITVAGRGMTADDAFELPPSSQRATTDQLDALLAARRSIRRFAKREIDRATIDRILQMTSTAPMGIPPSDVGVVAFHGADRVQAFATDACDAFRRMGWFVSRPMLAVMRPFMGKENYLAMRDFVKPLLETLVKKRSEGIDWFTYDAPAALLLHYGPMADPADCHIAATYAMLAAESFGLGSCLLGTTAALNYAKPFKAKYGIPPKNKIGLALVLGYPAEKFRNGVRRRLASVAFK